MTDIQPDKAMAAVCGLYCESCSLYIATKEDPARLQKIAARYGVSNEEAKCYGCRSSKRGPYCSICTMADCAKDNGVDFCVECPKYPCDDIKAFQAERPHRAELWKDADRIKEIGYEAWVKEIRNNYTCPKCGIINSGYDLECRACGENPSCNFVANNTDVVEAFLRQAEDK